MKKSTLVALNIIVAVLLVIAVAVLVFWEPILDLLPVDQSRWEEEDGNSYYYEEKGDLVTGWIEQDGKRSYLDPEKDGAMATGWLELDGKRYYFDSEGALCTGWIQLEDGKYFLDEDGAMVTGWVESGDGRCYLGEDGLPCSGWLEAEEGTYYLDENGLITTGWVESEAGPRYLGEDGLLYSGWLEAEEGTYYLDENGAVSTGWQDIEECAYYFNEEGLMQTGWLYLDEGTFYLDENGAAYSGWLENEAGKYFFDEDGSMHTGWLEEGGSTYYLKDDGTPALGRMVIEGETYYFTSTGANIILVNPWNPLSDDYTVDLVTSANDSQVAAECAEALEQMLADCKAAGYSPLVLSSYRTIATQQALLANKINEWQNDGYSYSEAYAHAIQIVAVPGTSEHHLGLAVDIVDSAYTKLNYDQADRPTQKWLMEHCWEYGFILRYPTGTTSSTGIIYEPWHYRYVGTELSLELQELGICLEDYLDALTEDGSSNQDG